MIAVDNIPAELRDLSNWVNWRYEERDGQRTKPPINARSNGSLRYAKSNDPSTWTSFDDALAACGRHSELAGVGFCFSPDDGLTGLDLDHVIDPDTGELKPEATEILERFRGTYAEVSPSGTGLRLFCRGKPKHSGKNIGETKWLEVYSHPSFRYLTVTGNRWSSNAAEVTDQQASLDWLHERFMKSTGGGAVDSKPTPTISSNLSDDELLAKAHAARNGAKFERLWSGDLSGIPRKKNGIDPDYNTADLALCNLLAFWTNKDAIQMDRLFRRSKLMRDKWDSKSGESTYGQNTIVKAIAGCRETYGEEKQDEQEAERLKWLKGFAFLINEDLIAEVGTGSVLKCTVFDKLAESKFPKAWKKALPRIHLARSGALFIRHECYYPGEPRIVTTKESEGGIVEPLLNIYNKPKWPKPRYDESHEGLFIDHLRFISGRDEAFVNALLNFIAMLVQKPGRRINWIPLLIAPEKGTGRGMLLQILTEILGKSNVGIVGNSSIGGSFHDALIFKQLICIDEFKMFEDSNAKLNEFKTYATEPRVPANRKGRAQITVDNTTCFISFSNYENAIAIDRDERRYAIATCYDKPKPEEYYTKLANTFLSEYGGNIDGLLHLLLNRDLSDFDPFAPAIHTEAREEMVNRSMTPNQRILRRLVESREKIFANDLFTFEEFEDFIKLLRITIGYEDFEEFKLSTPNISRTLNILGIKNLGQKRLIDGGKKESIYAVRNIEQWRKAAEGEIRDYMQGRPPAR